MFYAGLLVEVFLFYLSFDEQKSLVIRCRTSSKHCCSLGLSVSL